MKDGILVLNKPQEWTSSDCVAVCRRMLGVKGIKKVGHGGTLDPMATGVLPIFVGQATRIMEYMDLDFKTYICRARLGITTDTLDIWGEVLLQKSWSSILGETGLSEEDIEAALDRFKGEIMQMPPKYSAVRINGKRLYEYAYSNREPDGEIKPRRAYIKSIRLLEADMQKGEFAFEAVCSKGTYIRTICSDIGEILGCGCTMTSLTRTAVGNIDISMALVTAEQVKKMTPEELETLMVAPDYPLVHFGKVTIPEDRAVYFSRGNSIRWSQLKVEEESDGELLMETGKAAGTGRMPQNARGRDYDCIYRVYQKETGEFLGTGFHDKRETLLKADKVFIEQR